MSKIKLQLKSEIKHGTYTGYTRTIGRCIAIIRQLWIVCLIEISQLCHTNLLISVDIFFPVTGSSQCEENKLLNTANMN